MLSQSEIPPRAGGNNYLDKLETLGFSQKEAAVYLALLGMKKGSALQVAKAAGIKRPTAYLVLQALRQKKLVAATQYRGIRDFRAYPLEHLKSYIHKQKNQAEKLLPQIEERYEKRPFKARLRVYGDLGSLKTFLEKSLREKSPLYIFGSKHLFTEYLGDYWPYFLKRAQQLNVMPHFKHYAGRAQLVLWSDKTAFVRFSDTAQVFGFKNPAWHNFYQELWTRY
ncbi:MAG: helix-turn-helix domain-containing protein [Candidatus Magasanikbacteria bacterium]|nr:helix-turn-helix domain-containing protein [Candidatus Magasanikbacteria bacterium]